MATPPIPNANLFLTAEDPAQIKPSPVALKAIAKAPLNMALYGDDDLLHPVVQHVVQQVRQYYSAYQNQWNALLDKWDNADGMYWMAQKESRMPELTRSKVSASVYHRVCRRLAGGAYLACFSEDMPVKYFPDIGIFDSPDSKKEKAIIAEGLNRIALYYMKKCDLKVKAKTSFDYVYKYGNHVVHVPYEYLVEKKRGYQTVNHNEPMAASDGSMVYKHTRTGEISAKPHPHEMYEVEQDEVTKDWVGYYPLEVDQFMLDNTIDSMDLQQCFFYRDRTFRSDLFSKAKTGIYKNIDRITIAQQFQQYNWQNQAQNTRITNAGKTTTDSFNTEVYEHWQIWIMLPKIGTTVNKKGEVTDLTWDQNAEPCRYVLDIIGDPMGNSVVVRFSDSPYWGNGIPFICAHSHEDDSGWYHRGLIELLDDQMLQEQVAKGQLMDNRALLMFRPIIRQKGKVMNKDMRITHNTVFEVIGKDAIEFMTIPDFTQNLNQTLEYLKRDSEAIAQVPPFMLGEALGGRTSATEFASIRDQSSAPQMNDIKSLNLQLFGGYLRKVKEYVPQFLDKSIAIEVGGDQSASMLRILQAEDFKADVSIEEYAVGEFQNKQAMQQIMINLAQVLSNPMLATYIQPAGFLERFFQQFNSVFPNPEEIIRKDPEVIAMMQSYLSQIPQQGQPPGSQMLPQGGSPFQGGQPPPQMGNMQPSIAGQQEAQPMNQVMGASRGV